MAHEFGPGEYRMRGGQNAVVLERHGADLFGRFHIYRDEWRAARWTIYGGGHLDPKMDLLPPAPPVVVSDEAVAAFHRDADAVRTECGREEWTRAGLAAAYPIMRRDNP